MSPLLSRRERARRISIVARGARRWTSVAERCYLRGTMTRSSSIRLLFAIGCFAFAFSSPCMWAQAPVAAPPGAARPQSADLASQPPYDRLELLATFRAFESRSYLIEKIRTRGVDFTPDEAFLGAVDAHLKSPDVLTAIAESLRSGSPESPERRKAYLILAPVILDRLTPAIREQYDAAVALAPDSPALHMAYGGVLFLVGDFRAAEAQEWLSIQLWPGDADAHLALAFALAGQG